MIILGLDQEQDQLTSDGLFSCVFRFQRSEKQKSEEEQGPGKPIFSSLIVSWFQFIICLVAQNDFESFVLFCFSLKNLSMSLGFCFGKMDRSMHCIWGSIDVGIRLFRSQSLKIMRSIGFFFFAILFFSSGKQSFRLYLDEGFRKGFVEEKN